MGLFEKQTILFEGTNQFLYHGYQQILRNNGIRFKTYATDNQLKGGCCGLNSGTSPKKVNYTYSIIVKENEARVGLLNCFWAISHALPSATSKITFSVPARRPRS